MANALTIVRSGCHTKKPYNPVYSLIFQNPLSCWFALSSDFSPVLSIQIARLQQITVGVDGVVHFHPLRSRDAAPSATAGSVGFLNAKAHWLLRVIKLARPQQEHPWIKQASHHILLTSHSGAAPRNHLSLSVLWQRQETLWCQLRDGSPSNVKFVCLRLSWWGLSESGRYSTLHCRRLTSPPALFRGSKATRLYVVYHYTLSSSRHVLSGGLSSTLRVLGSCSPC